MAKVRVIDCDTQQEELEEGGASFETPAARAPQDEEVLSIPSIIMPSIIRPRAEERPKGASRSTHNAAAADTSPSSGVSERFGGRFGRGDGAEDVVEAAALDVQAGNRPAARTG